MEKKQHTHSCHLLQFQNTGRPDDLFLGCRYLFTRVTTFWEMESPSDRSIQVWPAAAMVHFYQTIGLPILPFDSLPWNFLASV